MMALTPEEEKRLLERTKEIFAEPVDEAEADEFMRDWPVFDIADMKPGDVVAIHFPRRRPKSNAST